MSWWVYYFFGIGEPRWLDGIVGSMGSSFSVWFPHFGMKKGSLGSNGPMDGGSLPNKGCVGSKYVQRWWSPKAKDTNIVSQKNFHDGFPIPIYDSINNDIIINPHKIPTYHYYTIHIKWKWEIEGRILVLLI